MTNKKTLSYVLNIAFILTRQGRVSTEEIAWLRAELREWFFHKTNFNSLF